MLLLLALCLSALAGDLKIHVLDVGQGDAILLEAANGKRALVDAGTKRADVAQMLEMRGIKELNLVVATHAHADHIGGMPSVLKTFDPKIYVDNSMPHTTLTYSLTMAAVRDVTYRTATLGRSFNLDKDVKLTILHPGTRMLRGTRSDLNSNSVVIRVDHGEDCILLTGDAEDPTERVLLSRGIKPCGVLKVAHHGSEHSTSAAWLRAIKPKIALISAGKRNRYGHPDPKTLARLESAGVKVYRTDLAGTLTIVSTSKGVSVKMDEWTAGKLPVAMAPTPPSGQDKPPPTHTGAVNINKADAAILDSLPGIGPARAAAIIADRKANGPYTSCTQLQRIKGIGPKTVAGLAPRCIIEDPKETP